MKARRVNVYRGNCTKWPQRPPEQRHDFTANFNFLQQSEAQRAPGPSGLQDGSINVKTSGVPGEPAGHHLQEAVPAAFNCACDFPAHAA